MKSRLKFLMEMVMDYNDAHELTKATFRLSGDEILLYVEAQGEDRARMVESYGIKDVTEETIYEIYREMKATEFSATKQDADITEGE